jgi:polysaccharide pyruvyl transferase WcaK-like protein
MNRKSTAFMSIKTQFDNVGDALIIRELINNLARRATVHLDLSRCPKEFIENIGIGQNRQIFLSAGPVALLWQLLFSRLKGEQTFYFLIPGGMNGEKSLKSYLFGNIFNIALALLKIIGVSVCQIGISYEKIGRRHASLLRKRTKILSHHYVRDTGSLEYARSIGLTVSGVIPDLAFSLFGSPVKTDIPRETLAFSFRFDKDKQLKGNMETAIATFCRNQPAHRRFRFVAQVARDKTQLEEIAASMALEFPGRVEFVPSWNDIDTCRDVYRDCEAIYSNRLHALLMAASAGCKPVAVVDSQKDPKIIGIFNDLDLGESLYLIDRSSEPLGAIEPKHLQADKQKRDLTAFFDDIIGGSQRDKLTS